VNCYRDIIKQGSTYRSPAIDEGLWCLHISYLSCNSLQTTCCTHGSFAMVAVVAILLAVPTVTIAQTDLYMLWLCGSVVLLT
jgi:hypothetical protein